MLRTHRQREHPIFLEKNSDSLPDIVKLQGTNIHSIDQNLSLRNIVNPGDQGKDGALPRAVLSDDYLEKISMSQRMGDQRKHGAIHKDDLDQF